MTDSKRIFALPAAPIAELPAGWTVCRSSPRLTRTDIDLRNLGNRLVTGQLDAMLFVTAWAVNVFVETCSRTMDRDRLLDSMRDATMIAASHSASRRLSELDVPTRIDVTGQTSWREILIRLDSGQRLAHLQLALEAIPESAQLRGGLEARGAHVTRLVPAGFDAALSESEQALIEAARSNLLDAVAVLEPAATIRLGMLFPDRSELDCPLVVPTGLRDVAIQYGWRRVATFDNPVDLESLGLSRQTANDSIRRSVESPCETPSEQRPDWWDSPFMKAVRREPTPYTPVWLMRQAGRYMEEYRAVRDRVSFLDLCRDPDLCSEVMCTAVQRLGVDAAIIFSDLLPMLIPMGMDLEYQHGDGPVIHNPIRSPEDVARVRRLSDLSDIDFVFETVRRTRRDLPAELPLIGFAGAPFTLASYMIEGRGSRNYAHSKRLMFGHRAAWSDLMDKITESVADYLIAQLEAGAQCVQIFDSWAGCLNPDDYRQHVLPWMVRLVDRVSAHGPVINFATGNPELLELLAQTQAAVIGVDWRIELAAAWQRIGFDRAVQGNLDPTVLLTNQQTIRKHVRRILDAAAQRPGHIFNLGHGVLPMTPVDHARAVVDIVHELSRR